MKPNAPDLRLLAAVSRSFYLSLRSLPPRLREPLALAYLLARTSDTIADTASAPLASRRDALQRFRSAVESGSTFAAPVELVSADPAERELLVRAPELLAQFFASESADRAAIAEVLSHITRGQLLDLDRAAMPDAAALEEYTWLVAGCVGEFWTRLCLRHVPDYTRMDGDNLIQLGASFGKGLQLVNILRDLPADLAAGRAYLPGDPHTAFPDWWKKAVSHVADGARYIEAVRPWRLRLAVILPWWLAVRTLAMIRENPPMESSVRVKVPRAEVRRLLLSALFPAVSNAALRSWQKRAVLMLAPSPPLA